MYRFIRANMTAFSFLGILLVLQLDLARVHGQAPPSQFVVQIEQSTSGQNVGVLRNLMEYDQVFAYLDAAWPLFPFKATKLQIQWQTPPGSALIHPIKVVPLLYEVTPTGGVLRYESDIAVLQPNGLNEIPLTRTHWTDPNPPNLYWLTSAIFPIPEMPGPSGVYASIVYLGKVSGTMNTDSPNIASSTTAGPWTDFNLLVRDDVWYDMAAEGLPGNLIVRLVVEPLCPERLGDMPAWNGINEPGWDGDIDNDDRQALLDALGSPGSIFDDVRVYMDLDNNGALDTQDVAILDASLTGPGVVVGCPTAEILTPSIESEGLPGVHPANGLLQFRNAGPGEVNVSIKPSAFWLGVSPAQATSQGEAVDIDLIFNTETLDTGVYSAWVLIEGGADSPQVVTVTMTIQTEGDFDSDGDVDIDDIAIFEACGTGPGVPYDPMALPLGCPLVPDGDDRIAADSDRDGDIDHTDFGALQSLFGKTVTVAMPADATDFVRDQIASGDAVRAIPFANTSGEGASTNASRGNSRQAPEIETSVSDPEAHLLLVGLITIVFIAILIYLLWGSVSGASFFAHSTNPNVGTEIQRIRDAIDRLNGLGHPDANQAFLVLGDERHYNSELFGGIVLNRESLEDVSLRATVNTQTQTIGVHESYVLPGTWDDNAERLLTLILFAEWQHIHEPTWTEDQCQVWLDQFIEDIGWTDLRPLPFHHGTNEGANN